MWRERKWTFLMEKLCLMILSSLPLAPSESAHVHTYERIPTHTLSHTLTDLAACPLLGLTWTMSSSCVSLTRPTRSLRQPRERMWSSLAPPSLVSELVLKLVNFDPLDRIQLSPPLPSPPAFPLFLPLHLSFPSFLLLYSPLPSHSFPLTPSSPFPIFPQPRHGSGRLSQ